MSQGRLWLLAAVLLALLAPQGLACGGVPCGYVYPRLLFELGERGHRYTLTSDEPLRLEGTLTFTWDITAEGLAVQNPTVPIVVTFQFPRKPDWLHVEVEPAELQIPISPEHVEATNTPTGVQLVYRYTAPIAVEASLDGPPVVDPEQPPSLLILAQSSESGLYKPGFGVRDLPLELPEALVQTAREGAASELRVGAPEPLALGPLELEFEGATLSLQAGAPVELWKPASLVARALRGSSPARAVDMAASVVDEDNEILYTTGLRHRADGALSFGFTFPEPGHYRVLVAARPVPGASDLGIAPVVAEFDLVLPGLEYDALRYPDAYRARYVEPTSELHANAQDLPRQFEKLVRFPVLAGADSVAVQVRLGASGAAALGAGSIYASVLGPQDEELAYGKLDALSPTLDARLKGPLPAGEYKVRLVGTGLNPQGQAGSVLTIDVGVFYPEQPLGLVRAKGEPRLLVGGAVSLGTGNMELDLVLHEEPALWKPLHAMLVAKDREGRVALHPDFILTVRGPDGFGGERVLYTTGHRHPHDGLLHVGLAFPAPGLYTISAFAAPTAELSGAFWQPAIASWPLRIAAPADGRYPASYEAFYHDSTSALRTGSYAEGSAFDQRYPVPVKPGAEGLHARLDLLTMAMVQMVEGVAPASLTLEVLGPQGASLASRDATIAGGAEVEADAGGPGLYWVRVSGAGYAPLDYSGAMYNLTVGVGYAEPLVEPAGPSQGPEPPRAPLRVPAAPWALALLALALLAAARRR